MNPAVMTTETSTAATLSVLRVLFSADCARRRLGVIDSDRVADHAIPANFLDVELVREERAVCELFVLVRIRRLDLTFSMANHTARFLSAFGIAALWRMAGVTFGVRRDGQKRRLRGLFVAVI